MNSPIENGKFICGSMVAHISDDYSIITITKNGNTVALTGSDINDLYTVLKNNVHVDGEDKALQRFDNFCGTTGALPTSTL